MNIPLFKYNNEHEVNVTKQVSKNNVYNSKLVNNIIYRKQEQLLLRNSYMYISKNLEDNYSFFNYRKATF